MPFSAQPALLTGLCAECSGPGRASGSGRAVSRVHVGRVDHHRGRTDSIDSRAISTSHALLERTARRDGWMTPGSFDAWLRDTAVDRHQSAITAWQPRKSGRATASRGTTQHNLIQ